MKTIVQDILTIDRGMIAQQVNCRRIAGGGLALSTAKKWPGWKEWYRHTLPILGQATFFVASPSLVLCNLYGQQGIGPGLQTDYPALTSAIQQAAVVAAQFHLDLYLPYWIGCGLAGGDWGVVEAIIQSHAPDATLCQLPGQSYE